MCLSWPICCLILDQLEIEIVSSGLYTFITFVFAFDHDLVPTTLTYMLTPAEVKVNPKNVKAGAKHGHSLSEEFVCVSVIRGLMQIILQTQSIGF